MKKLLILIPCLFTVVSLNTYAMEQQSDLSRSEHIAQELSQQRQAWNFQKKQEERQKARAERFKKQKEQAERTQRLIELRKPENWLFAQKLKNLKEQEWARHHRRQKLKQIGTKFQQEN